ncbi:MAG: phosphate/phosphite/phosphonate ABC transporter substrate-binding protein [Nitrospirae bacterium]|nr:phosphate/phosphite/phosphonate ABC transporter substrate-binding protein [Nitrospirota bacterium]MCL5977448.1 phosphate/phosphite/phosphonate ABC transporter substrate-binding protein [Nitrospirota bacterium]
MRFTSVAITLCLLAVSCSQKPEDIARVEPKNIRESTFTIAILPEQNVFEQKKRYKPLAEYLSKNLNMNVKIKLLDSYGSIYDEIKNKTIDGAVFGSFNYVLTKARADIEPVARPMETGGNSNYKGIIFTRKDTGLTADVKTWKDKKIALVHEVTTAGYVFPAWHLKKHGVISLDSYFSRLIFSGSHDAAILSVFKGQADIGAAKDLILQKMLSENPAIKNDIVILAGSVAVPSNSLCLRSGVDNKIKESLKKSLLSMHHNADGKTVLQALNASKFIETADSEFDALRQMAKDLGIDIKSYPFRGKR